MSKRVVVSFVRSVAFEVEDDNASREEIVNQGIEIANDLELEEMYMQEGDVHDVYELDAQGNRQPLTLASYLKSVFGLKAISLADEEGPIRFYSVTMPDGDKTQLMVSNEDIDDVYDIYKEVSDGDYVRVGRVSESRAFQFSSEEDAE